MAAKTRKKRAFHDQLVALFVERPRLRDVVEASGIPARTVERWKADPENWAEVEAIRGEALQETLVRLRKRMPTLADELAAIAQDQGEPSYVRVNAIAKVFDVYRNMATTSTLEHRVAELEARLATQDGQSTTFSGNAPPSPSNLATLTKAS